MHCDMSRVKDLKIKGLLAACADDFITAERCIENLKREFSPRYVAKAVKRIETCIITRKEKKGSAMAKYDFDGAIGVRQLAAWGDAVVAWANSKDRSDYGPTIGFDNGFKGWKYQPTVVYKDGKFLRISFTASGETPERASAAVRKLRDLQEAAS